MHEPETSRLARLAAILTQLQSKRLLTATEIAARFSVSIRTVYRDIRALEAAGVPIFVEEGKGYSLLEGYRLPPVMFTENEANALITAEQLVMQNKDASLVKDYAEAMIKIKSVLRNDAKSKTELLAERLQIRQNTDNQRTSHFLSALQMALVNFKLTKLAYQSEALQTTERMVEPFALYSANENWLLVAYCRLRQDYRTFRLDRILKMEVQAEIFKPHKMTLKTYLAEYENYF